LPKKWIPGFRAGGGDCFQPRKHAAKKTNQSDSFSVPKTCSKKQIKIKSSNRNPTATSKASLFAPKKWIPGFRVGLFCFHTAAQDNAVLK
jgi:hypothetical protein